MDSRGEKRGYDPCGKCSGKTNPVNACHIQETVDGILTGIMRELLVFHIQVHGLMCESHGNQILEKLSNRRSLRFIRIRRLKSGTNMKSIKKVTAASNALLVLRSFCVIVLPIA